MPDFRDYIFGRGLFSALWPNSSAPLPSTPTTLPPSKRASPQKSPSGGNADERLSHALILPTEVMIAILEKCPAGSIGAIAQINREWNLACSDNYLWFSLCRREAYAPFVKPAEIMVKFAAKSRVDFDKDLQHTINWRAVFQQNYATTKNWMQGNFQTWTTRHLDFLADFEGTGSLKPILYLSFDQQRAITINSNKHARLWDLVSGKRLAKITGHSNIISVAKFDQKWIVTGSSDRSIRLWDINTGEHLQAFEGHEGEVSCLQFDSEQIISGSEDRTIRVWRIADGTCLQILREHKDAIYCLQFAGNTLVSSSADGNIFIWDLAKAAVTTRCMQESPQSIAHCLQFDQDWLIAGCGDGSIRIWRWGQFNWPFVSLTGHSSNVVCLQFDKTKLISGSADHTIKIWNMDTFKLCYTLQDNKGMVWQLRFDKTMLISSALDNCLRVRYFGP